MRIVFLILFALLFVGCNENPVPAKQQTIEARPEWITNPNLGGVIGSVGSSGPHFKGPAYQRKLAISRALDELALQQGVEIDLVAKREENLVNDNFRSSTDIQTEQKVQNAHVTAHIKATYTDPKTKVLYVWMVLN